MKLKTASENDFITNKIIFVFSLALLGVLALMGVYRLISDTSTADITVLILKIIGAFSLACTVIAIPLGLTDKRKGNDEESSNILSSQNIAVFFVILSFCCFFIAFSDSSAAIRTLYIIIPAFAILYLIKSVFMRDFFTVSLICSIGSLLLWGMSNVLAGGHVFLFPLLVVLGLLSCIAMAIVLHVAKGNDGIFSASDVTFAVMDSDKGYSVPYLTLAILAVLFVVSMFVTAQTILWFSFAVLGYLFILTVYYTVKLM